MSKDNFEEIALQLVRKTYVNQGVQNLSCRDKKLEQLMTQKKIPDIGMDDQLIEYILDKFASMDSNNFESNVGVGEREGRVYSSLVLRRSYYLSHGIGRSGDIAEEQPKAAGSSIIYKLTNSMATHALELAGFMKNTNCLVLPLATGMALTLCMTTLRQQNPSAIYVIFSRIDQKSCFKSISTAALIPLVVDHLIIDGELQTDLKKIEELLEIYGNKVLCVLSTTSCFAPRQPDSVDKIAQICKVRNVGHIINNAYGLQCKSITKLINRAFTIGRVDAVVQSTDKNFMVPVGGSIVASLPVTQKYSCIFGDQKMYSFTQKLAQIYPGRANMSPILDLFMTLLCMGKSGLLKLWNERNSLFSKLKDNLTSFAERNGCYLLASPNNFISIALSLNPLEEMKESILSSSTSYTKKSVIEGNNIIDNNDIELDTDMLKESGLMADELSNQTNQTKSINTNHNELSFIGSMLFQRNVSGCRVIQQTNKVTTINSIDFLNWGSHVSYYPVSYITAACSIGITENDINVFMKRLDSVWEKFNKKSGSKCEISNNLKLTSAVEEGNICLIDVINTGCGDISVSVQSIATDTIDIHDDDTSGNA